MGASAREIERQIDETRARMDENLTRLEGRTRSGLIRYGKFAAAGAAAVLVAGVAFLLYRRRRRHTLVERFERFRLRDRLPSMIVRFNEKVEEEPGLVEGIARQVGPALAGTAARVILGSVATTPDE